MSLLALGFPRTTTPLTHGRLVAADEEVPDTLGLLGTSAGGDGEGALVLVRDQPDSGEHEHRARVVRALSGRTDVAVVAVREPATRGALLLHCLDHLAAHLTPLELHAVVPAVNAALRTLAVVDSAGGLRRPAPSVALHALGLLPGSRLAVDLDADTVGTCGQVLGSRSEPVHASTVTVVGKASDWLDLLPATPPETTFTVTDVAAGDFWRAGRFAEVSTLVVPLDQVVERALSAPARRCPSCDRSFRDLACPYCGVLPHTSTTIDLDEVPAL